MWYAARAVLVGRMSLRARPVVSALSEGIKHIRDIPQSMSLRVQFVGKQSRARRSRDISGGEDVILYMIL